MLHLNHAFHALTLVAGLAALSACATPPESMPQQARQHHFAVDYAALGGRTSEINHWIALNGDCSVAGFYTVQIVAPPAHGQAEVKQGQYYPRYTKLDTRGSCDTTRRDGLALNYTPSSGYAGPDHLTISVITPTGAYWATDFNIIVPALSPVVASVTASQRS